MVAEMTVLPGEFPVTCPELSTLAIVGSELSHKICRFTSTIFSDGVPTISALSPTPRVRLVGARRSANSTGIGTLLSGAGVPGLASTLRFPASTRSVSPPERELAQPVNKARAATRVIFRLGKIYSMGGNRLGYRRDGQYSSRHFVSHSALSGALKWGSKEQSLLSKAPNLPYCLRHGRSR